MLLKRRWIWALASSVIIVAIAGGWYVCVHFAPTYRLLMTLEVFYDVWDEFGRALNGPSVSVDTTEEAESLATRAYKGRTGGVLPRDSWQNPIRVHAEFDNDVCILQLRSGAQDGVFGTADDIVQERRFFVGDLRRTKEH